LLADSYLVDYLSLVGQVSNPLVDSGRMELSEVLDTNRAVVKVAKLYRHVQA
jgi:hypothetical protein